MLPRVEAFVLVGVGWLASLGIVGLAAYLEGKQVAAEECRAAEIAAFEDVVTRAGKVAEKIGQIGRDLASALTESRELESERVRTVTRIIREAPPEFGATRRPPELDRLRREDLARIASASADRL